MQNRQGVLARYQQLLNTHAPLVNERVVIAEVFKALTGQDIQTATNEADGPNGSVAAAAAVAGAQGNPVAATAVTGYWPGGSTDAANPQPTAYERPVVEAPANLGFKVVASNVIYGGVDDGKDLVVTQDGRDLSCTVQEFVDRCPTVEDAVASLNIVLGEVRGQSTSRWVEIQDPRDNQVLGFEIHDPARFEVATTAFLAQLPAGAATPAVQPLAAAPAPAPLPELTVITSHYVYSDAPGSNTLFVQDGDETAGFSAQEFVDSYTDNADEGRAVLQLLLNTVRSGAKGYRVVIESSDDAEGVEPTAYEIYDVSRFQSEARAAMTAPAAPQPAGSEWVPLTATNLDDGSPVTIHARVHGADAAPAQPAVDMAAKCITVTAPGKDAEAMNVDSLAWLDNGRQIVDAIVAKLDSERGIVRKQMLLTEEPFDGATVYNVTDAATFKAQAANLVAKQDKLDATGVAAQASGDGIVRNW